MSNDGKEELGCGVMILFWFIGASIFTIMIGTCSGRIDLAEIIHGKAPVLEAPTQTGDAGPTTDEFEDD